MSSRQGAAMRRRPTPYDRSVNRTNDNSPAAHSPATRVTRPLSTPQNPGLNRGTPGEPASQASLSFRTGSRRQSAVGSPRLSMRPSGLRAAAVSTPAQAQESDGENNLADSSLQADALNEVIMAIDMNNSGNLGCAYYVAMDEALFLLEDIAMAGNEIVETLLLHVRPTTVLTPARTAQGLLDMLAAGAEGENGASHHRDWPGAYILRTLQSTDFRYESAKEKLLSLPTQFRGGQTMQFRTITDEPIGGHDDDDLGLIRNNLMRLGASINLESRHTIGCVGAVLGDLQRRRNAQYLPDDPDALVAFRVRSVEMFTLFDSMFVNADTLASLQILQTEFHPNSQMRGPDRSSSGAKENLSVYGLFQHLACTPQGKSKLRQIFLRPSIDIDLIRGRQQAITLFLRPENSEALKELTRNLRKVKNVRSSIAHLQRGVDCPGRRVSITNNVWATLQRFALHALNIRGILAQMQTTEELPLALRVMQTVQPPAIYQVGELVSRTIDFEQSRERERTAVKHGVDVKLDEMKRSYNGMEDFLTEVNEKIRRDIPAWAQPYVQGSVFYPQLGFLAMVSLNPETGRSEYEGEGMDEIWERMFVNEGVVYCKNRMMRQMDEQFGDAYCMIMGKAPCVLCLSPDETNSQKDRETEILHELSVKVLQHEGVILATSDVLGELDSILALAIGSGKYNWVAPAMTDGNDLQIKGGRHPLQELVVPAFVTNDCYLSGGDGGQASPVSVVEGHSAYPSTLILVGPNHSGKSVYLKQVALIVYLAHIGCFVPADQATIGITDRILTRIMTRESVARNESAFAIDLRQAAFAINFATRRSLVVVDEFGKGTNSFDGAGLMTALVQHFTGLGTERPKLLAATHFHEIFEGGFLDASQQLALAHMDVRVDFDTPAVEDQVTYLFKLRPGRSVSSFGSRCAAMNGVDEAVVERAEAIMLLMARGEDVEVACTRLSPREEARLREAESTIRAFLTEDLPIPPPSVDRRRRPDGHDYQASLERILLGDGSADDVTLSTPS